jgi:hypothetical protein
MAYGKKYTLPCKTRKIGEAFSLELWLNNYAGSEVARNMPADMPLVLRKDKSSVVQGTSLEFGIREAVDFEMDEFYTNDPKYIKAILKKNTTSIWTGFVLPNQYNAPYISAPLTCRFTATDGMGILTGEDYEQTGINSELAMIIYCLDKIGLGLGYSIAINLFESSYAENRSPIDQTYQDAAIYKRQTCHYVLENILEKYNAEITQSGNRWRITCRADKKSTRMLYTSAGIYEGTENAPTVLNLGMPESGADVWPTGNLVRTMEPGARKVILRHNYGRKKSLLTNYDFWNFAGAAFTGWTKTGTFTLSQRIKDGKAYAFLPTRAAANNGEGISQSIEITNVAGQAFVFELDFAAMGYSSGTYSNGLNPISMTVRAIVTINVGGTDHYLTTQGWDTTLADIELPVTSCLGTPVWNKVKIITAELPGSGTLTVALYRYYIATPRAGETYIGVCFSEPCVYFLQNGELYASGVESVVKFTNSKEPGDLGTIDFSAADAPVYDNNSLLYENITRRSDESATTSDWHRLGSASEYSLLVQYARMLASDNRIAREKLTGTIRGVDLTFDSIITHAYHANKEYEIIEGSWDIYEEKWDVTLRELLAWSDETVSFTSTNENDSREITLNSDGSLTGSAMGNEVGSPAALLTAIKTVDGTGSGLDADLLDGQHGSYYAPLASPQFTGAIKVTDGTSPDITQERTGTYSSKFRHIVGYSTEGDYAIVDDKDNALRMHIDTDGDVSFSGDVIAYG